ncbi:MAG: lipoate protein ligase C-terminal domain-containing protein [Candidatus Odinarchaeota archaeon]
MNKWNWFNLGEIDWINTQSIWHAAALSRSRGYQEHDMIFIDWPNRPFISCGMHQIIELEIDVDYCENNGIPYIRRACGGGQVYLDGNQIFYQPVFLTDNKVVPRRIDKMYETLLAPVVATYQDYGIEAAYKPVNDIVVNSRKISGNGAGQHEKASFVVGNFILTFPRKEMARVLLVPDEKFRDKVYKNLEVGITSFLDEIGVIPSRDKLITKYKENFQELLGVEFIDGEIHEETWKIVKKLNTSYFKEKWRYLVEKRGSSDLVKTVKIRKGLHIVQSLHKSPGGLIRALLEFDVENSLVQDVLISGDFTINPSRAVKSIENALKYKRVDEDQLLKVLEELFREENIQSPGFTTADLVKVIVQGYKSIKD